MKHLKPIFAFAAALALLFTLCACGSTESNAPSTTESTEPSTTQSSQPTGQEISLGTVTGSRYENDSIGLACEPGSGWYIYSKDEIAQLSGLVKENVSDEDLLKLMENNGTVIVFYAAKDDGANSVNITVTNTGNQLEGVVTEEQLLDATLPQIEQAYPSLGYDDLEIGTDTVTFAGTSHPCIVVSATVNGAQLYQRQVFLLKGTCSVCVTSSSYFTDTTVEQLALFEALS